MPFPDKSFFDEVYCGRAPWDVESAQPDLMALLRDYPPAGPILDLGCGTGDLAIALAKLGHRVLGVDFAPAAIEIAGARAAASMPTEQFGLLEFRVADALDPSVHAGNVGSIVDSGFFHLFEAPERRRLAHELGVVLPKGGRYYMLGFGIVIPSPDAPRRVTAEEIAQLFSVEEGWVVRTCRTAEFLTSGFGKIPALATCVELT